MLNIFLPKLGNAAKPFDLTMAVNTFQLQSNNSCHQKAFDQNIQQLTCHSKMELLNGSIALWLSILEPCLHSMTYLYFCGLKRSHMQYIWRTAHLPEHLLRMLHLMKHSGRRNQTSAHYGNLAHLAGFYAKMARIKRSHRNHVHFILLVYLMNHAHGDISILNPEEYKPHRILHLPLMKNYWRRILWK